MHKWRWAVGAALVLMFQAAQAEETPATPKRKHPPAYPAACMPSGDEAPSTQLVTVVYDVSGRGLPENVRVRETTDECYNDVAVAAIRKWTFEPRKVDYRRRPQEDMETTFTFVIGEETIVDIFDARPKKRIPPRFPELCATRAANKEEVTLQFDVTEKGRTENIIIVDSTNDCFNRATIGSVKRWKYEPRLLDGKPVARPGVETKVVFTLISGKREPEHRMRSSLVRKLNKTRKLIKGDPGAALAALEEIEAEYGATLTSAETAAFHQIRGFARIGANDARGALDDLRIARGRVAASKQNYTAIREAIQWLEVHVAAVEAQERAAGGEPATTPESERAEEEVE